MKYDSPLKLSGPWLPLMKLMMVKAVRYAYRRAV